MGTIPEAVWGTAQKPGTDSQTGCVYCLADGNHVPLDIVYYWMGTSLCFNHVKIAAAGGAVAQP